VNYGDKEALMGTCFSTTDWHIKVGKEGAFTDRWTAFLKWTQETQEGFESARLVIDEADPQHHLSVGEWRDSASRQAWASEPRFAELIMPCLELCEDVQSSQFEVKLAF
jgi:heme-degrading monooxygenase HmoA